MLNRVQTAVSALRGLLQDPDDTAEVFRLFQAVSPGIPGGLRRRFEASGAGTELLLQRPQLREQLRDRESLAALPEGSLGRAYLRFVDDAGVTADGLALASGEHVKGDDVAVYIGDRMRDAHDLWHVVTGYKTDLVGEAALLAFTLAQTGGAGVGILVAVALSRAADPDVRRLIVDGWLRGLRSAWLPAVHWEALLRTDLDDVRHQLRLGRPRHYQPVHAHELPEGGLLSAA